MHLPYDHYEPTIWLARTYKTITMHLLIPWTHTVLLQYDYHSPTMHNNTRTIRLPYTNHTLPCSYHTLTCTYILYIYTLHKSHRPASCWKRTGNSQSWDLLLQLLPYHTITMRLLCNTTQYATMHACTNNIRRCVYHTYGIHSRCMVQTYHVNKGDCTTRKTYRKPYIENIVYNH